MYNVLKTYKLKPTLREKSLMLISIPLKKLKEFNMKKIMNKKVIENLIFYFTYCVQKFSVYNFFE